MQVGKNLIHSRYSLVSLGTERLVALGKVPQSSHEIMRVPYMLGTFSFPCSYGYSLVGVQTDTGRAVHLMHPHQDLLIAEKNELFSLPDHLPLSRMTLLSNMETAVNIFWDSNPTNKDKTVIIGGGLIGLLTASVFSKEGFEVCIKEIDELRADRVKSLGFRLHQDKQDYSLLINTSGNPYALQWAIDHCMPEGRITEASWFGDREVKLQLGANFHSGRIMIKSSQVGMIPKSKRREWNFLKRKKLCLDYLEDNYYDKLLDHTIPFSELPREFDRIRQGDIPYLSLLVKY